MWSLLPSTRLLRDRPDFADWCTATIGLMTQVFDLMSDHGGPGVDRGAFTIEELAPDPYMLERCPDCHEPHEWIPAL